METTAVINDRATLKAEFIAELEARIHKEFLRDWAMGWMLDIAIDIVIERNIPEEQQFRTIFTIWREKCMELATLVLTDVNDEAHLYGGVDLTRISPEICQRWRTRFAQLTLELGIR